MGVEPTSLAWEAKVIAVIRRPHIPEGIDAFTPKGYTSIPIGYDFTNLFRNRSPSGSQHAFTSGQSFHPLSVPLQLSFRFFHHPLPTMVSDNLAVIFVRYASRTPCWAYHVPHK